MSAALATAAAALPAHLEAPVERNEDPFNKTMAE